MNRVSVLLSLVATALMIIPTVALAAEPTQADFDACNRIAQSKLSSPSASPQTQPQTGTKSPSSPSTPQAAPSPKTAGEARVENQADQLRGIAGASKDDPAYQRAYRDCLKARGL